MTIVGTPHRAGNESRALGASLIPRAGTHLYPGPLARFSEQPLSPLRGPAPTLGQHNHELLCDLIGVSEAE